MRGICVSKLLSFAAVVFPLMAVFVMAVPAHAVLGENQSSISSDQSHLKASARFVPHQFYSVQEMETPTGTTVRQFVSPQGTVFAVTWQGSAPDLETLLGSYFDEFMAAAKREHSPRGRGIHIDDGDLVVQTGGHMRFVVGRAFLRSKTPSQVTSDEIR
jgi:hypothetical protein